MTTLIPLSEIDPPAVEHLLDRAFGRDRHERTAYRVRAGLAAIPDLSFAALDGDNLVGSIQCWAVALEGDDGATWPMVMVGPVAVAPEHQQRGVGRILMERALAAAVESGDGERLMLVGDPEYYERFFGFTAAKTAHWRLPGPVDHRRLLARGTAVPDMAGLLAGRR